MITRLKLTNFKSIGKTLIVDGEDLKERELDFTGDPPGPPEDKYHLSSLTVFCGKNSSGKSTVLQSILLLVQTLQNNVPSQTLVLNGPLVKLGSIDDIKTNFSPTRDIAIDIDFKYSQPYLYDYNAVDPWKKRNYTEKTMQIYNLSISFNKKSSDTNPVINQINIDTENDGNVYEFNYDDNGYFEVNEIKNINNDDIIFYKTIDISRKDGEGKNGWPNECHQIGLKLNHFLPEEIFAFKQKNIDSDSKKDYDSLPVTEYCEHKNIRDFVSDIKDFFQNNIVYIGPLREEPHLLYNSYIDNINKVGSKGENCAAVLYHSKDKLIKNIKTEHFINLIEIDEPQKVKLKSALEEWLNYIGVSCCVNVSYDNEGGYKLKVKSAKENNASSYLTNVGVGVSQVLPIVLACLLAPEESTIIIEQPELHLHPAMQTKLTDFFIATILCNKQLIIETHSEYIINKLRLRVVNCPSKEPINDRLNIYFTETLEKDFKEFKAGNTIFRPLEINEYAAMSDWPEGFFDESSKTADEIIRAASLKWKQEKGNI